jgi:phosphoribosylformimino-5-aminoimidazole carboxamide ribotide isomerase
MEIIAAIDILNGKCVRLTQGDYAQQTVYSERPLEVAKAFEDAGVKRVHLVDLDGAKAGAVKNWKVLEQIADKTDLRIDFGGGIHSREDIDLLINAGAQWATVGSMAVKNEDLFSEWLIHYGPDRFLLGADVRDEKIAIHGWLELTEIRIADFISKYTGKGIRQLFCTDISRDGLLGGPAIGLYKQIIAEFPQLHFIASGGVGSVDDIYELQQIGCHGVIIGKAIYEGKIRISDLSAVQDSLNQIRKI